MDAIDWKDDIPVATGARHIFTEQEATSSRYSYRLRGNAGRWFVQRSDLKTDQTQRTPFYRNRATAEEILEALVSDDGTGDG
jgi:hypothetical protein